MSQHDDTNRRFDEIDANLKRIYKETLEQDVPDRFKKLLDQLKAQESQDKDKASDMPT